MIEQIVENSCGTSVSDWSGLAERVLEGQHTTHDEALAVLRAPDAELLDILAVEKIVPEIKARHDLEVCACLGLLTPEQAQRLAACGVNKVNHNLNTSAEFYEQICTTHSYQDRVETLKAVRAAGLQLCSGGIIGMGEQDEDVVRMALALRELEVESIPLNFLIDIEGTPLTLSARLTPRYCLKALAMFRFVNPTSELRRFRRSLKSV